jgi:hypothetical protein
MFDWGESGKCCSEHSFLLQQSAGQLQRTVQISPLAPVGPVPLTRDERVRLKSESYALEAELEEAKARGLELYRENQTLAKTAQAARVRATESEAQLKDALADVARLRGDVEQRDQEHGALVEEVERLRTLEKFLPDTDHTRVDG